MPYHKCVAPPGVVNKIAATPKIEDLDECQSYINRIDFTKAKTKMASEEGSLHWSRGKTDAVERRYKQYLFLKRKHMQEILPPPDDVDVFWHFHILDTLAYHRDSQAIFGGYLHHHPYPDDERAALSAFETTKRLYSEEFDIDLDQPMHL